MSYWIPEDVQTHWASLLEPLQEAAVQHADSQIEFAFVIRNGYLERILEPVARPLEPRSRSQAKAQQWWSVIRRLQSIGNGLPNEQLLEVCVTVNAQGDPVCWTTPQARIMEPRKRR